MKNKNKVITFQEIIERLNKFWASKGCLIGQPYGLEVGAGTSNPNTFLRSLGPESFNVAYVEPSRRPDDGRYGQNPYRLQHYFQYQIILKPAPENNQELYLQSLEALGIDTAKHDIRFVEDNWESPAIGAWGLGWEVWLDGMEITQYTYFQQVAGIPLDVPVLEITLGLERLAMYIQGVDDYRDIMFNEDITYGQLFEQHEYWQSKHNYETADIKDLENVYALMKNQVVKQLDSGNYWVAYDYLLKISHIFNILDSRGVISVTDRISRFDVMGKLSNHIGQLYLEEREKLNYPMSDVAVPVKYSLSKERAENSVKPKKEDKLVVELYFEEFPADFISNWRDDYNHSEGIESLLESFGLSFKDVRVHWSSRRIVIVVNGCGEYGKVEKDVYGPMYDIAFTDGKINKVGEGFLKKHGAKQKDIVKITKGGNTLLGIHLLEKNGLDTIVTNMIEFLVNMSPQSKKMKWLEGQSFTFIRPLRNILCFKDDKKINLSFWDVKSSDYTFCARSYPSDVVKISSAQDYLGVIKKKGVIIDEYYRDTLIRDVVDAGSDRYEYSENTHNLITVNSFLAEFPNMKFFTLDEKYSELPIELIKKVLEDNQKYIIRVLKEDPSHVEYGIVANKKGDASDVFKGNRKVVQGRLDDALFYWGRDVDVNLKNLRKGLDDIVFHPKVGSYKGKVERIKKLVKKILNTYTVNIDTKVLEEALTLIKNDKATSMVQEFASLEGVVGMYYARREGYSEDVAKVLYEHYLPTSEFSDLPSTNEGVLLGLVDKLDNVLTFSEIGGLPQGSNDPYEIRKNVYSLIRLLRDSDLDVDLYGLISSKEVVDFFNQRIYQSMRSGASLERLAKGIAYSENGNIAQKFKYFEQMRDLLQDKDVEDKVFDTLKRVYNILEKEDGDKSLVKEDLLETGSEKDLYKFISSFKDKKIGVKDLLEVSNLLEDFFKETMVNVDEVKVRSNRVALLKSLKDLLKTIITI